MEGVAPSESSGNRPGRNTRVASPPSAPALHHQGQVDPLDGHALVQDGLRDHIGMLASLVRLVVVPAMHKRVQRLAQRLGACDDGVEAEGVVGALHAQAAAHQLAVDVPDGFVGAERVGIGVELAAVHVVGLGVEGKAGETPALHTNPIGGNVTIAPEGL